MRNANNKSLLTIKKQSFEKNEEKLGTSLTTFNKVDFTHWTGDSIILKTVVSRQSEEHHLFKADKINQNENDNTHTNTQSWEERGECC